MRRCIVAVSLCFCPYRCDQCITHSFYGVGAAAGRQEDAVSFFVFYGLITTGDASPAVKDETASLLAGLSG